LREIICKAELLEGIENKLDAFEMGKAGLDNEKKNRFPAAIAGSS
jgi:hypothetical protein